MRNPSMMDIFGLRSNQPCRKKLQQQHWYVVESFSSSADKKLVLKTCEVPISMGE